MNMQRCFHFIRYHKSAFGCSSFCCLTKFSSSTHDSIKHSIKQFTQHPFTNAQQSLFTRQYSHKRQRYHSWKRNGDGKLPSVLFAAAACVWTYEHISDDELREALEAVEDATGERLLLTPQASAPSNSNRCHPSTNHATWLDGHVDWAQWFENFDETKRQGLESNLPLFHPTYLHRFHDEYRSYIPASQFTNIPSNPSQHQTMPSSPSPAHQTKTSPHRHKDDRKWEQVLSDKNVSLRAYRRPLVHIPGIYEYLVVGTFDDISAHSFFEVQSNLQYRKQWDPETILVEVVKNEADDTELVRWIVRFPLRMSPREYVFVRRLAVDESNRLLLFHNKTIEANSEAFSSKDVGDVVKVTEYVSTMVVRPHTTFDQPGLDYFLLYYDNPRINVKASLFNWAASSAIPKFMKEVHKTALHLEKTGWQYQRDRGERDSSSNVPSTDSTS